MNTVPRLGEEEHLTFFSQSLWQWCRAYGDVPTPGRLVRCSTPTFAFPTQSGVEPGRGRTLSDEVGPIRCQPVRGRPIGGCPE